MSKQPVFSLRQLLIIGAGAALTIGLAAGIILANNQRTNYEQQKQSLAITQTVLGSIADTAVATTNTQTVQTAQVKPILNQPPAPAAKDRMTMVFVPAGNFKMGSLDSDNSSAQDERPQHIVYLDAFWVDKTEITNKMFAQCVAEGTCEPPDSKASSRQTSYYANPQFDDFPMINVSWEDSRSYCQWAGRRLPSEAEWEKAARGTDARKYPWGDMPPSGTLTNYGRMVDDPTQVGSYPLGQSAYGAMDMAGNVWEWVMDWYSENYYQTSPQKNPTGPDAGKMRVLRGGSYYNQPFAVTTTIRLPYDPTFRRPLIGFRCVQSVSAP